MITTWLAVTVVACALPLTLCAASWLGKSSPGEGASRRHRWRRLVVGQVVVFAVVYLGMLGWAMNPARAEDPPAPAQTAPETAARPAGGLTVGDGLAMLGIALATGVSVLGAGYAVGVVGAAALGTITEKPEMFGRTLIFIGLAEGLAIYGLIVSILLLGRLR
jgi:V/A-type H+-transporting ATPase subunit K